VHGTKCTRAYTKTFTEQALLLAQWRSVHLSTCLTLVRTSLHGKNQSERRKEDTVHPKKHESLVILSSQRFSAYKLCSPVLVPMRVPAGTVRVEQDRQQDKNTDFENMQY
jgi:hypothetical protein